jgi:glycosyltransferase involved in cell wall biosynthesis
MSSAGAPPGRGRTGRRRVTTAAGSSPAPAAVARPTPLRALFINDYLMAKAMEEWRRGEYPAHHLFGVTHLPDRGVEVEIVPYGRYSTLRTRVTKVFGDLWQQWSVLRWRMPYDVLYSGSQYDSFLLSVLRRLKLYRHPLVATMHHLAKGPLRRPRLFRALYGGHDMLLCMSAEIRDEIVEQLGFASERVRLVGWAVDLDFYTPAPMPSAGPAVVIAAGKTKRDYDVLVEGASGVDCRVEIYCSALSAPTVPVPPNVSVHYDTQHADQTAALSMRDLLERYRTCRVVAIPLQASEVRGTTGLTSLLEALAMGRPVIMTTNGFMDIERAGVGVVVEPGDGAGWRAAMASLAGDMALASEMGARARELAERDFGMDAYTDRVAEALFTVTGRSLRPGATS